MGLGGVGNGLGGFPVCSHEGNKSQYALDPVMHPFEVQLPASLASNDAPINKLLLLAEPSSALADGDAGART